MTTGHQRHLDGVGIARDVGDSRDRARVRRYGLTVSERRGSDGVTAFDMVEVADQSAGPVVAVEARVRERTRRPDRRAQLQQVVEMVGDGNETPPGSSKTTSG